MRLSDFIMLEALITDLVATAEERAIAEPNHSVHRAGCLGDDDPEGIAGAALGCVTLGTTRDRS
jgi:hypothetical protein